MSQQSTLQAIYDKVNELKCCNDSGSQPLARLDGYPFSFLQDGIITTANGFGILPVDSDVTIQGQEFDLQQGYTDIINAIQTKFDNGDIDSDLTQEYIDTINAQFRIIQPIPLPVDILKKFILELLLDILREIIVDTITGTTQECPDFNNYQQTGLLENTQKLVHGEIKYISITITVYPTGYGRQFSNNDEVPDFLTAPIYLVPASDNYSFPAIRLSSENSLIELPDCATYSYVYVPIGVKFFARYYFA